MSSAPHWRIVRDRGPLGGYRLQWVVTSDHAGPWVTRKRHRVLYEEHHPDRSSAEQARDDRRKQTSSREFSPKAARALMRRMDLREGDRVLHRHRDQAGEILRESLYDSGLVIVLWDGSGGEACDPRDLELSDAERATYLRERRRPLGLEQEESDG